MGDGSFLGNLKQVHSPGLGEPGDPKAGDDLNQPYSLNSLLQALLDKVRQAGWTVGESTTIVGSKVTLTKAGVAGKVHELGFVIAKSDQAGGVCVVISSLLGVDTTLATLDVPSSGGQVRLGAELFGAVGADLRLELGATSAGKLSFSGRTFP